MEQLYHVICTHNIDNATYVIMEVLADDRIQWRLQCDDIGNDLSFNIFECKRLIELSKQEDTKLAGKHTYEIIPAKID